MNSLKEFCSNFLFIFGIAGVLYAGYWVYSLERKNRIDMAIRAAEVVAERLIEDRAKNICREIRIGCDWDDEDMRKCRAIFSEDEMHKVKKLRESYESK